MLLFKLTYSWWFSESPQADLIVIRDFDNIIIDHNVWKTSVSLFVIYDPLFGCTDNISVCYNISTLLNMIQLV